MASNLAKNKYSSSSFLTFIFIFKDRSKRCLKFQLHPPEKQTEWNKNREMTGRGTDEDSKSEAKTVIQSYYYFLMLSLLCFFLSERCEYLLWDGNCCSDCPPWESRKIQFHRYTMWKERCEEKREGKSLFEKETEVWWEKNMRLVYRRAGIEWKCNKYIDIVFSRCLLAVAPMSSSSRGRRLSFLGALWWPVTRSPTDEWPYWIGTDM